MIGLYVTLKVQPGKGADFEAVAKNLMAKVKANEPGCLTYTFYKSRDEADTYHVLEEYVTVEDHAAHGKTDYFRELGAAMGAFMAAPPSIVVLDSIE